MKQHYSNKKLARKPLIMALEPRLLLDGAAVATAVDVFTDAQLHQDAAQANPDAEADRGVADTTHIAVIAPTEVRALDPAQNNGKKEVVFIESNVADYQSLVDGVKAGIEVVLLDASQDGLAQMAAWAQTHSDYDAIHIISHGSEGKVNLGNLSLNAATVNSRSSDLALLGSALNEQGDLLLYGCSVASGEGQDFITALAQATQADVAASDDLTGAASLGGDWDLENTAGSVESTTLEASDYSGVLTTVGSSVAIWAGGSEAIAATTVGAGVEHDLSGGTQGALFDIDPVNNTITFTFDSFPWSSASFDAVFSGGTLDQFTGISRTGGTATNVGDYSATVNGKVITFNVPEGTLANDNDGTVIFTFTSTAIGGNNAPTITGAPADITVTEDTASNINLSNVTFADSDGDNLTVTLTASAGTLTASSGGSVTVSNSGTGTLTLSGTAANINTYLDTTTNIQYTGASNASGDNAATLTIKANDSTVDSSTSTVNIDIAAVNDAPTAVSPTTGTVSTFDSDDATVATVSATDVDDSAWKYSIQSISLNSVSQANDGSLFNLATDADTLVATNALRATTPSGLTAGTYIVTVVATDAAGLSKTQEITITVTDTLVVTTANDTSEDAADAYNGNSYAAELADGGGLSLREALGLAAAGGKTIAFAAGLHNRDISLDSQVTVADGTVFQLANGTSFTISGSNLFLGGALTIDNATGNNLTLSANLTDSGYDVSTLNKTGAGTLVLSGTNNIEETGLDTIVASEGRLQISDDNNLGGGNVTLRGGITLATVDNILTVDNTFAIEEGGASFNQTGSGHLTLSNQVAGSGLLTKTGGGSMTLSENNDALDGGIKITNGTLNAKASVKSLGNETVTLDGGTLAFSDAGTVGNNITVSADAAISNSDNVTLSGQISGSGVLTKAGAGTMTWSPDEDTPPNTHSGDLIISAGTLAVSGGSSVGNNSAVTVNSGATLSLTGGNETIGSLAGSGAVSLTYGLTVGNASNTVFSGVISSTNTSGITKVGSGTLALSGANTYTGATTVSAGKLLLQGGSAIADSSAVTVSAGAELELRDNDEAVGSVAGAGTLTLNGASLTVGGNNNSTTFSGVIQDSGGLTKIGTGTLTLSGSNTYAGATDVLAGGLSITGDSNLGSGALTLNSGTLSVTGDGANIDNAISLSFNGGVVNVNTGVTATLSGVVSGPGDLTKAGAGRLALSGTNTFSGSLSVTDGTLAFGANNNISSTSGLTLDGGTLASTATVTYAKAITLGANGGTLNLSSGSMTLSGVISGSGRLTSTSTNAVTALTLSGINTYTGGTTLNSGILQFNNDNAVGSGTLTIEGGKVRAGLASRTLSNDLVLGGTLTMSGSNALTFTGGVDLGGADRTIDNSITSNLTFSGVMSNGSLTIAGSAGTGAVILSGTNTHTNTTISGGNTTTNSNSLSIASDASLGTGTLTLNGAGAVLNITGATTIDNAIAMGSSGGTVSNANAVTLSGVVSGTGALTKAGAGVLTLSGNNADYSGNIALNEGVIIAAHNNALGNTTGTTTVASGTTLRIGNGLTLAENLTISGVGINSAYGALKINEGTGSATVTGDITLAADSLIGAFNADDSLTLSGVISGDFDLTKVGSGTLTLSGSNTHTGAVTVSGGTLALLGGSNIADTSAVTVASGASLTLSGGNETIGSLAGAGNVVLSYGLTLGSNNSNTTFSGVISSTNTSGITKTGSGTLTLTGTNTYTGATTVSAGTLVVSGGSAIADASALTVASGATFELDASVSETVGSIAGAGSIVANGGTLTVGGNNNNTTFSGVLSERADALNLVKIGSGTLTLSGNNTYSGNTTVSGGTLSIAGDSNLGSGALTLNSGSLSVTGNGANIDNAITLANSGVLNVDTGVAVAFSGLISGSGSLLKTGAGTATLSANNTYTGATSLNAGTLSVTGALAATSGVTVNSGATLAGSGSVFANSSSNNLTVNSGGFLAPGLAGAGTLTVNGNLILLGTLKADITGSIAGTNYDQVVVSGGVTLGANSAVDVAYSDTGAGNTYILIDKQSIGAVSGALNGIAEGATFTSSGHTFTTSYTGGTGNDVTMTEFVSEENTAPVMTSDSTGSVNENASTTTVIYTATATDPENNTLTYSLTGADAGLLNINATTGEITLKASADYETKSSYSFSVVATDSGNLSVSQAVMVSVIDLNDNAPVITSGASGSVDENAPITTVIYTAVATDADGTAANQTLNYSLSGADAALLSINATTGEVRLNTSADYETKASYSFTVVATDSGNLSSSQAVTVSVNDLVDNTAPVITSGASGSVDENSSVNTVIYTVTATDAENDSVSYSLTGADAGLLSIDSVTGEVRLIAAADFETKNSYSFNVVATDKANLSSSKAITVTVNDLNENVPSVSAGNASNTLVEAGGLNNATAGNNSATIDLTINNVDAAGTVHYDTDYLTSSGWVTTDGGASYSKVGTYGTATFTVASGAMGYVLNDSDSDTQALTAGQAVNDRFTVQVTDGSATASVDAVFNINGSNDAPTVTGTIAAMSGAIGQVFTPVTLPANLFADVDGTETSQLVWRVDNLPAGLVFNAATRTISGTPTGGFEGLNTLQIVATDPNGGQISTSVSLTLAAAPVIVVAPAPVAQPVVTPVSTSVPISIDVVLPNLQTLPSGTISSTSGSVTDIGSGFISSVLTGTGSLGGGLGGGVGTSNLAVITSSSSVIVDVGADGRVHVTQAAGDAVNTTGLTVAAMTMQRDKVSITLADRQSAASYSATLADGSSLPSWVTLNPTTGEVTMTPPAGQGKITLKINAVDANGNTRILEVEVDLEKVPASPQAKIMTPVPSDNVASFVSLDQQLTAAAEQFDDYGSDLMKLLAS